MRARLLGLLLLLVPLSAAAQQQQPEPAAGRHERPLATAEAAMVVAAHPLAAEAGAATLEAGGTAADAVVAAQLVLNLVEPQSSGLGGGGFLLHHDSRTGRATAWDGRETAPLAAGSDLFLDASGAPLGFWEAVVGGRGVGTPGTVALLHAVHAAHGRLPWPRLFEPAIRLAEEGFAVSPRLAALLAGREGERLRGDPAARALYFPAGEPLAAGDTLRNPAFAATLRAIAEAGPAAFYRGAIAGDIVAAVQGHAGNPGLLAEDDLAGYRVVPRDPVCAAYRGYRVCGMGPPSSGALTVGQILALLEHFDLGALGPGSPLAWHLFAEASKLAYADRGLYMADDDFVAVPVAGLLDPGYVTARAQRIARAEAMPAPAPPGNPPWRQREPRAAGADGERPGTTHLSIVDAEGNAIAYTGSIEQAFGATLMVRGFLLNNELTDFSFRPEVDGVPVANRVQPGKRPRSSMAPTLVYGPDGRLAMVLGSPGGSRIIAYVAQTLVAMIDWGLDPQAAVALGHVFNGNGATQVEAGTEAEALAEPLRARGHEVAAREMTSGLHVIRITPDGLQAGIDPRREGRAVGW